MSGGVADFPLKYPVLIGTRSFAIDTSFEPYRRQSFHHDTIPAQRESIELTDVPGEGTINTEGLWRRGQVSWHHGGGQVYADRKESDPYRWLYSFGVDPWTENQLTLLPATYRRVADSTTYNWCTTVTAGGTVYHLQGNANPTGACRVRFTTDYVTWTTPTGLPANDEYALATDGTSVWCAGIGGVYVTTVGGASWTQVITDDVDHIYYVSDRLIVSKNAALWDITNCTGAAQTLGAGVAYNFMTHTNASWKWLDFTAGESFIYAGGVVGNPSAGATVGDSIIYQITVQPKGTNLATGTQAFKLAPGEFVGTLYAYSSYIFAGTNLGIRCMRTISQYDPSGNAGDLISGPLLPNLTQPVQAPFQPYVGNFVSGIVGYNRWIWFSWPGFTDSGNTYWGLGRLDLGTFIADLQPAYASDLTVVSSATSANSHHTLGWDPITQGPLMIVPGADSNAGLYTQDYNASYTGATKYVSVGNMRAGRLTYDIQDNKTLAQANLRAALANAVAPFDAAVGTITLDVSYDEGAFASLAPLAPQGQANPPTLVTPLTQAEEIEIQAILTAGTVGGHASAGRPFLRRWTAKALPNVVSGIYLFYALRLYVTNDLEGDLEPSDPYDDYAYLENLRLAQTIITVKEGSSLGGATQFAAQGVINELYWMPQQERGNADGGYEGDLICTIKTIVG